MKTRFILIETSHAGNVGACARAMKTMGFDDLVLVRPRWSNVLHRQETIQRASGALHILEQARIVDRLEEAVIGIEHLCATAMTPRDFGPRASTPRDYFETWLSPEKPSGLSETAKNTSSSVAFLFGSERFGMKNEDVYRCHVALTIPSNPEFGSLNLASALQLIAYEWRMALGGFGETNIGAKAQQGRAKKPDAAAIAGVITHWEHALIALQFLDPAQPKKLMPRLQQILNRTSLDQKEVDILRGIAAAILDKTH